MTENQPDFGAAGSDSNSEGMKRVTKSTIGRLTSKDALKLAGGTAAIVTLVCGGLAIASLRGVSTNNSQENVNKISDQYKALMEDPKVKDALRRLNLGEDETGRKNRDTMLYNSNITDAYLAGGDRENWENLIGNLEKGNDPAFFGQMASLNKANCLLSNGYVNVSSCESHPGFKNLDAQTKKNYVDKFNAAVKAHPSLFPSVPPKMSGVDSRQVTRRPDLRKLETNMGKRSNKEQRSVRRPFA